MHGIAQVLSRQRLACLYCLTGTLRVLPCAYAHKSTRSTRSVCSIIVDHRSARHHRIGRRPLSLTRALSLMPMATTAGQQLVGEADRYDGIILDADHLPSDPAEFSERLAHSLKVPTQQGRWMHHIIGMVLCTGAGSSHHSAMCESAGVARRREEGHLAEGADRKGGAHRAGRQAGLHLSPCGARLCAAGSLAAQHSEQAAGECLAPGRAFADRVIVRHACVAGTCPAPPSRASGAHGEVLHMELAAGLQ